MNNKLDTLWEEMVQNAYNKKRTDSNIVVNDNRKEIFFNIFDQTYAEFKKKYMKDEVEYLDRHKVAAILIYAVIKTKIMEYRIKDDNRVFLDNYYLAFSTGMSYMQYEVNISNIGQNKPPINKFKFPDVLFGKKSYIQHIINMLYVADLENHLNLFELANILFLLEIYNNNLKDNNAKIFTMEISEYSLLDLLEKQREICEDDFWKYIFNKYDEFMYYIEKTIKEIFPHIKPIDQYTNEFLANQIFKIEVMEKDLKALHKYSLIAIKKELGWLKEELARYKQCPYNSDFFMGEMRYLWNIIFSIQEYVEIVQSYNQKQNCRHHVSRRGIGSGEIMYLARRMPRFEYYFDDIAQGPVSIFLIRQGIELRIIEILGIMDINMKEDNSLVKITPDRLLTLLKKPQIKLPIAYNIIEKIHSWTNLYVHRARIYDYWEMEWAVKTIQPFIFEKTQMMEAYAPQLQNDVYAALGDEKQEKYTVKFGHPDVKWCEKFEG